MEYTTLGRTGRKVSRIGYGGTIAGLTNYMRIFDPKEQKDKDQLIEAMQTAFKMGINYFDTAASYGDGTSEKIFGEALEKIPKDEIFLATKAGASDPDKVRASLERSLKNLRRDWIDLIQFHGLGRGDDEGEKMFAKGGLLEVLEKAKAEGLVKHIGFTQEPQNIILIRAIKSGRFDTMQIQYNLLYQHPYEPSFKTGCMYMAEEQKMGIITMRTMTSGIFQRWIQKANPQNTFDYTPALLQNNLSNPLIDVCLVAMHNVEQVKANVAICDDKAGRFDLDDIHTRYADKQAK